MTLAMPGEAFSIAPVESATDLAAVSALFKAYAASLEIDLSYQNFVDEVGGLPGKYSPPDGDLLLARSLNGEPIGCVGRRPLANGSCEMKRLYVAPAGRGSGVGRALMIAVIDRARDHGYCRMKLDTLASMTTAQAMYRKVGFEPTSPYYDTAIAGTIFMSLDLKGHP